MEQVSYIFGSFSRRRLSEEPKGAPKRRSVDSTATPNSTISLRRTRTLPPVEELNFQCYICKRQLIEPRVLPCLHTFCTRCLLPLAKQDVEKQALESIINSHSQCSLNRTEQVKSIETNGGSVNGSGSGGSGYESEPSSWSSETSQQNSMKLVIICPVCNWVNKLPPGGVPKLPLHYVMQNKLLLSLQQSATCDLCTTDTPAVSRCEDCQVSLCGFCSEAHQRQRASALHEVVSIAENGDAALVRRQVMCETHPNRELRLFCGRCGIVVCRDCCVLEHRSHPCDTAARAAKHYARALREAIEKTQPLAKEVTVNLSRLQYLENKIQSRCDEVETEIDRFADSYKTAIEEHRIALQREVSQVRHTKMSTLHKHHLDLQARSEQTSTAMHFAQELLSEASDIELLNLVIPSLKRLEWCNAGEVITAIKVSDCLQFLSEEKAGMIKSHPMFGVITTQAISPQHCTLQTEGLLNCRQHKKAEFLLSTYDCDKQPLCHGGAQIVAELQYRDGTQRQVPVQVSDQGDGTYILSFVPEASGNLSLSVTIQQNHIQGSPFNVSVSTLRPHPGVYHCCSFCSSNGNKAATCGCGGRMPGGYKGCGHGHAGHPGRRHWSCCGNLLHNSECSRSPIYQFTL